MPAVLKFHSWQWPRIPISWEYCENWLHKRMEWEYRNRIQVVRLIMDDRRNSREVITILFLCLLWYGISSSSNVVGKMLLSEFPYPMTVTMVQLTSITVYSGPFFNLWGVRKYSNDIPWGYYLRLIVPLALGKFVANVFSHVSIWKVPVSYAHTGMRYYFDSHVYACLYV